MGIIILIIGIFVEVTFAFYCIVTKSTQQLARNIIRISAFVGFVLFSILPILNWSYRYYTLAIFLFIMAILGLVGLIRGKYDGIKLKWNKVVLRAAGMIVLFCLVTLPSIIFPQYEAIPPTGKYEVESVIFTYTDSNRIETYTDTGESRKINVELWYPSNVAGKYPLIVFSHGGLGIRTSNETLYNELASHGYVVASIDHTYQGLYTTLDGKAIFVDKEYMRELNVEDAHTDKEQSYEYYQKWMQVRTGDINFVIDYIIEQSEHVKQGNVSGSDRVYKLVDTEKIGVMGHSLGGSAALGIGRMRTDISAVIALESPFMVDIIGVENDEFVFIDEEYPVPVLNVYSDSSWDNLGNWPQYAQNHALLSSTSESVFNVHISGAGHFTLTDLALTSPFFTRVFNGQRSTADTVDVLNLINEISLEFFDRYLK